jgi:hypothetical protein
MNCLLPTFIAHGHGHFVGRRSNISVQNRSFFPNVGAIAGGVFQEDMIEFAAEDLEREIAFILDHMIETPGGGDDAVPIDETDAGFADESFLQLADNAELLEQVVAEGEKRFADVFAGEFFAFEEKDVMSFAGEKGGSGGAGWAAADDDHVVQIGILHGAYRAIGFPYNRNFTDSSSGCRKIVRRDRPGNSRGIGMAKFHCPAFADRRASRK